MAILHTSIVYLEYVHLIGANVDEFLRDNVKIRLLMLPNSLFFYDVSWCAAEFISMIICVYVKREYVTNVTTPVLTL